MNLPEPFASDFRDNLEKWEGRTSWMYLDPTGNVTIGVGHMIPSAAAAEAIGLGGGGWDAVKAAQSGHIAQFYQILTHARLEETQIDALRESDIAAAESQIDRQLPVLAGYPHAVRQGVMDMGFNMGARRLRDQFFAPGRRFGPALAASDWPLAAEESFRHNVQPARNRYVADLIRSAAAAPPATVLT